MPALGEDAGVAVPTAAPTAAPAAAPAAAPGPATKASARASRASTAPAASSSASAAQKSVGFADEEAEDETGDLPAPLDARSAAGRRSVRRRTLSQADESPQPQPATPASQPAMMRCVLATCSPPRARSIVATTCSPSHAQPRDHISHLLPPSPTCSHLFARPVLRWIRRQPSQRSGRTPAKPADDDVTDPTEAYGPASKFMAGTVRGRFRVGTDDRDRACWREA